MSGPAIRHHRIVEWLAWPGLALALLALLRWSTLARWDRACTILAALGGLILIVWAAAHRAELGQEARRRRSRYGVQLVLSSLLMLGVVVAVDFLAARHNRSFDTTESGLFTLAPETAKVLESLPGDVTALAFFPAGRSTQAAGLLQRYADITPRFHFQVVDPDNDPHAAGIHKVTQYGTVVIVKGEADPGKASPSEIRIEPDANQGGRLDLSEEKLTNALVKVTRGGARTVYFLQGHGEGDIENPQTDGYSRLKAILENQAFDVKTVLLTRQETVPSDCGILIIAGPAREPFPSEMTAIGKYLQAGGKLMVLVDPPPSAGLTAFLKDWGLYPRTEVILDPSTAGRLANNGPAIPAVTDYDGQQPITRGFHLTTLFPMSRPLEQVANPGDAQVAPLALTGPESFAEPAGQFGGSAAFDPAKDHKGPWLVAAAVTRQATNGKEARLVAIGTSNLVTNSIIDRAGNSDFFLACMNWLAEQENLIAIQPRPAQSRTVEMTDEQLRMVRLIVLFGLPGLALIAGGIVYWRRR